MGFSQSGEYNDVLTGSYVSLAVSVSTSAVEARVGSSPLSGREQIVLYNDGSNDVYVGPSGVTATGSTKGVPLAKGNYMIIPAGETSRVYMIAASGTVSVIVQEMA